jgi:hypothetical protein
MRRVDFTHVTALHSVLTQDIVWIGLLVVWASSQPYITSRVTVKFVPVDRIDEDYEWLGNHINIRTVVTMGHVMTTAPIILMLESVEFKNGKRRSIVEVLGRRWLIVFLSLIFFSFSNSTTDGTTSLIAANYTKTPCSADIRKEIPMGVTSSGTLDNARQKSRATF